MPSPRRADHQAKLFRLNGVFATEPYSEKDTPIRQICKEYKKLVKEDIRGLCKQARASDPKGLSEELAMLLEGATVTAQVSQNPKTAQIAKRVAKALIDQAVPPHP